MAVFRKPSSTTHKPESPALLIRDLKRASTVKFLWDHQGKLLDEYYKGHLDTADIALELPTGSGKTLVALLIAEYRRRALGERAVFLCPTRQLCSQVAGQAERYGVPAALLVGAQKNYDHADFLSYQQAKAIAVTTYSGLFNVNPRIDDAELVICDDAHAAHGYVASLWTLRVNRFEHGELFQTLRVATKEALPDGVIHAMDSYDSNPFAGSHVDLVSMVALYPLRDTVADVLNAAIDDADAPEAVRKLRYPWSTIKDHFEACSVYCSGHTFEIGPIIPPTDTHDPFARAKQRIYMSATLGEDGDIERSFGRKRVKRLPVPEGWDKRGIGRRLILFPGLGQGEDTAWETAAALMDTVDRSLMLVPDDRIRADVQAALEEGEFPVLGATDIEESIDPFVNRTDGPVLLIANRWEGIDLPGDHCRLMAVAGTPRGASLHERYLLDRLGAIAQLRDRIRTRVTQAIGRCTRDEGDYAVVLMIGDDLVKWCCTKCNTDAMHPELQAEIQFGLANSTDRTTADILDLCRHFFEGSPEWEQADEGIIESRSSLEKATDATASALAKAASAEIRYAYRMWNGDYESAAAAAEDVLLALEGGADLKPYRSFWFHQLAVAAFLAYNESGEKAHKQKAVDALERVSSTSLGLRWPSRIRAKLRKVDHAETEVVYPSREWFREIEALLERWGITGGRFARMVATTQSELKATKDAKAFERGLETLGRMLGAQTHRWKENGAPDGLWVFGDWHAFVFEAKTDENPGVVSLDVVRQAGTHEERVRSDKLIAGYTGCTTVIVSNHSGVDRAALPHTSKFMHLSQGEVVKLYKAAAEAFSQVRGYAQGLTEEELQERAEKIYEERRIGMADLHKALHALPLRDLKA